MSRGQAYQRIHLLDQEQRRVELPFLELGEELWNPQGTRFTLLFDPGRIKQGLVPNLEAGLPLVEGQQFTLLIENAWLDANGVPMVEDYRKHFQVVAQDTTQPQINNWQLGSPTEGTREPLVIRFDEPLDHGLLQNTIHVESPTGTELIGSTAISANETEWRFTPDSNWQSGDYELVVEGILEARSANSLGRAFEVFVAGAQGPGILEKFRVALSIAPNSPD
jgi:hypothetical protein